MTTNRYQVVEKREVVRDLIAIAAHIEHWTGDADVADRTVDTIRDFLHDLSRAPHRGTKRDDLRPGLRIASFKRRTVVAFEVDDAKRLVTVLRIFYGGQDYEAGLRRSP